MVQERIAKKETNENIKWELPNSLPENDDVEEQGLNETANNDSNTHKAILIIYCMSLSCHVRAWPVRLNG